MTSVTVNSKSSNPSFKNHLDKSKKLFFKPSFFFEGVANEQKYLPILLYFVVAMIIIQLISGVLRLGISVPELVKTPSGVFALIVAFFMLLFTIAFSAGIAFAIPFVSAGIDHLGVLTIGGGKKGYFNTFKPATYSMIVGMIYGLVMMVVGYILTLVQPINLTSGLATTADISFMGLMRMIPVSYFIWYGLISIISTVHTLYIEVIGIAKFQGISKGRAFLAIIVPRIILSLITIIMIIILFQLIASLSALGATNITSVPNV
jgi:hypothetical protein